MKKAIYMPLLVAGALCLINPVSAEMYKWTDKNGETHYTQTPPPADAKGKDIEADIRLSTGKLGNTIPQAPTKDAPKDDMEKAREDGSKSEQKHRDFCAQQAEALKQMTANSLIKWKDADGGERFLTAEEKETKMKDMQKNISSMCKPEMFSNKDGKENSSQPEPVVDPRQSTDNTTIQRSTGDAAETAKTPGKDKTGETTASTESTLPPLPAAD